MLFFSPPAKSFSQFDNKSPIFFFYGFPKTFIKRMKLKKFIFPSCGTPWASTVEDENCLGRGGAVRGRGGRVLVRPVNSKMAATLCLRLYFPAEVWEGRRGGSTLASCDDDGSPVVWFELGLEFLFYKFFRNIFVSFSVTRIKKKAQKPNPGRLWLGKDDLENMLRGLPRAGMWWTGFLT